MPPHKNFAYSTVATAPSPATSGTSLVVAAGEGALFPIPPFNATIWPTSAQPLSTTAEIVRVTGVSTDTLTIARAQEGSSARTVVVGDQIAATITARTLTSLDWVKSRFSFFDDFLGIPGTLGVLTETNSGTSADTAPGVIAHTNRIGTYRATTGTTTTGRTALTTSVNTMTFGAGAASFEAPVYIPILSDVTERYAFVIGFMDVTTATAQTDAAAFIYDEGGVTTGSAASANWQTATISNASNRTFTTTSVAVPTATWTTLRIDVNAAGTSVDFSVDGVIVATHTATIPTGVLRLFGFGYLLMKSAGSTARTVDVDYIAVEVDLTTARAI